MALEAKHIALSTKKVLRSSIRKGYRFVSEHPVLFGLGVLLYLLYRSSPGFFGFLLSSSPVIICTTLLLGILLSYGEIDLPESSEDHKGTSEVSAFNVVNSSNDIHFEANQRSSVPEFRENASNIKEREIKQTVLVRGRSGEHVDVDDDVPLLRRVDDEDERFDQRNIPRTLTPFPSMVKLRQEVGIEGVLKFSKERETQDAIFIQDMTYRQTGIFDGVLPSDRNEKDTSFGLLSSSENVIEHVGVEENQSQEGVFMDLTASKEREISQEKQAEGLAGTSSPASGISVHQWNTSEGLNINTSNVVEDSLLDSCLGSPWARVSSQGSSGFDSDEAESSSPDASMTDIAPVLDEIDPLLGADSTHPEPIAKDDSDTDSHASEDHQIEDDSNDEADDNDAKDSVEGKQKNEGREAAFLWTADDEKNLMDLGYSEMERNRRLEILMARRRSRKNIRFETDNNLIDVDSTGAGRSLDDLSRFRAQVPPISVSRRNPFDLPYDAEEAAIPGSAPSILHARKNPFDLPLEQSNDSGVPSHDSTNSGQSVASSHRDMYFRRYESFNFGSTDAIPERRFSSLKPYFVPETMEWSTSNFQRQFSDKSESKLSSVTESDLASSVADQEDHKDNDEKELHKEHESSSVLRQDSDLADVESECSDGINSVDVELDNSDIDDREIALQHFVFERSQEREAYSASTKGKGREEDYTPKSADNSTRSFHPVPDLLSWEDGDGDSSVGAKPSFEANTEVICSEWISSSRQIEEDISGSGDLQQYTDTEFASSSNTVVLGASNPAEDIGNIDSMTYSNSEMPLDNLIHGSMEFPSEFGKEALPVISRNLHPIPEERVVENFNIQEKHETAIFTDSAAAMTGLHVIEEHFDVGSDGSLSPAFVSSYAQANDAIQSPSIEPAQVSNPFDSVAVEPNRVDIAEMKEDITVGYLLDSDDEAGKIYPEPMEDSVIDESFLSELDAVGDFGVQPISLDQQMQGHVSHSDNPANGVAAASLISPQTSDNMSLALSEASVLDSREQSPSVDDLNDPEFSWSCGASHGDPEQTVYNPRRRILEESPFEEENMDLKPTRDEKEVPTEVPSGDTLSATILAVGSDEPEVTENEPIATRIDPGMEILDAKSLEDIETAFKQVSDDVGAKASTDLGMAILDAKSLEDIDNAFKRVSAGVVAEASGDTENSQMLGVDVNSVPKEVAGQLHVIDAKSVDTVNSSLEEDEEKGGYRESAESEEHDKLPQAVLAKNLHNVRDSMEAEPMETTRNMGSTEGKTVGDKVGMLGTLSGSDDSVKSDAQAVESDGACERKEENGQQ
ncbi:hypothetical protein ACP4OV_019570 [Aristida adscensionis]